MKQLIAFLAAIILLGYSFTCSSSDISENKLVENVVEEENIVEDIEEYEEIRLLESITYNNGRVYKYEYDSLYRIIRYPGPCDYELNTLTYEGNELVNDISLNPRGLYSYPELTRNGNIITWHKGDIKFYLDNDGNLIKSAYYGDTHYKYDQNGNIVERNDYKFEYDDKKSPFIHCNTPKWWLQYNGQNVLTSFSRKNNIIKNYYGEYTDEYTYEYDIEGYPVKRIKVWDPKERAEYDEEELNEDIAKWKRGEGGFGSSGPPDPFGYDTAVYKYIIYKKK